MTGVWRRRLILAAPPLAAILLAAFPLGEDSPTFCPFALCTGTACPGCGMTRATSALIRGDVDLALSYHPLVVLVVAQVVIGWIWFALQHRGRVSPPGRRLVNAMLIVTAGFLLGVWLLRLGTGTLPPV